MWKTVGKTALWIGATIALMVACSVQADKKANARSEVEATRMRAANALNEASALRDRVSDLETRIDDLEARLGYAD